ncbi:hypothetical protein G5B30_15090 [Sphingobacterium sp. SGG-5]|uniref:hypothetical protein n=1 Tax=Sphingobacterium sp. SGG-5 TaxID=2710881 RepID=UPI0013ECE06F|nr:hypothetical protein [Sphingobacterium sp. SGG-5]NGM63233.1 hypothetical protein [Sphingobacterium sp. SGG-5]
MVTFEDFFAKKKIDLQALQRDKPELYTEFHSHYYAMGEKSFDHTKKFWFNRLRKSYKLNEPELTVEKTDSTAKPTSVSASLGFKSKFKTNTPPATPENANVETEKEPTASTQENKPTGFKPRFKAGVTKTADPGSKTPPETSTTEENTSKPAGFKPRFKTGVTKTENTNSNTPQQTTPIDQEVSNKPAGFKPRFKAGVTKTENSATEVDTDKKSEERSPTENKPTGFTPRFKTKITKNDQGDGDSSD